MRQIHLKIFFLFSSNVAALRDVIGVCCDRGRQYAVLDEVCSQLEYFPLYDIPEGDRQTCYKLAIGCCDHESQKLECEGGIDQRAERGSCASIDIDDNCYSTKKVSFTCSGRPQILFLGHGHFGLDNISF